MVWSVPTASGCKLLLVGSLHLLGKQDHPLPQVLFDGLDACDVVITETGSPAESRLEIEQFVRDNGMLPPGEELLTQELGTRLGQKLSAYLDANPTAGARLQSLRPWAATLQIAAGSYRGEGIDSSHGVDAMLLQRAAERGMRIASLESPTMQLSAWAGLAWEEQVRLLGEVLDEVQDGTGLEEYARLRELWRAGDLAGLARHMQQALSGENTVIEARLLGARNRRFAERIAELAEMPADRAEDCLVLVGAAHLVGSAGLLELLGERLGVALVRIMPAAGAGTGP